MAVYVKRIIVKLGDMKKRTLSFYVLTAKIILYSIYQLRMKGKILLKQVLFTKYIYTQSISLLWAFESSTRFLCVAIYCSLTSLLSNTPVNECVTDNASSITSYIVFCGSTHSCICLDIVYSYVYILREKLCLTFHPKRHLQWFGPTQVP